MHCRKEDFFGTHQKVSVDAEPFSMDFEKLLFFTVQFILILCLLSLQIKINRVNIPFHIYVIIKRPNALANQTKKPRRHKPNTRATPQQTNKKATTAQTKHKGDTPANKRKNHDSTNQKTGRDANKRRNKSARPRETKRNKSARPRETKKNKRATRQKTKENKRAKAKHQLTPP